MTNLREWRGNPDYPSAKREAARILLEKLADAPTLEQIYRDIPWLLLFGVLVAYVEGQEKEITVSVAPILEMLRRPREERELPVSTQSSSPKEPPPGQPEPRQSADPRPDWEPELVFIPARKFLMGTSDSDVAALRRQFDWAKRYNFSAEQPQHTVYLPDYYIGKYSVTNAQYRVFVQDTGHSAPSHWENGRIPSGKEQHPVVYVSWHDAAAYCQWLADVTGKPYRLPTEAEWEKAARGTNGWIYPWGDLWDPARCNHWEGGVYDTTPVGQYSSAGGDSPYGCADMAGNVWEWTLTCWTENYDRYDDKAVNDLRKDCRRVVRGGAFYDNEWGARCAFRFHDFPGSDYWISGFRVCVAAGGGGPIDSGR